MANAYFYSNLAVQTALSGGVSAVGLTITVNATTGFPTSFPYILALDFGGTVEELVKIISAAGNVLTIDPAGRGFGGTSAQSHSLGAVVRHVYNAVDATDFRSHEAGSSGVHGLAGAVVGTTDVQTLTNKTLTAPVTTGGTFNQPNIIDALVTPSTTGTSPVTIKMLAGQTFGPIRILDSTNAFVFSVNADGSLGQSTASRVSFTPTWTASTTNPVLGNGTLTGVYVIYGNMMFLTVTLTIGSTTNIGSGQYTFGLGAVPTLPSIKQALNASLFRPANADQHLGGMANGSSVTLFPSAGGDFASGTYTPALTTGDTVMIRATLLTV